MSGPVNHGVQWFDAKFITGNVTKVYPVDTTGQYRGRLTVDVLPLNSPWLAQRIPFFCPAGLTRNARLGMQVGLLCIHGSPKFATAMNHIFNQDDPEQAPLYADPLPAPYVMPDDLVMHHDETLSYLRFRNYGSTSTQAGPDGGSPVLFEIGFNSGAVIEFSEYPPPGYPEPGSNPPVGYVPPAPTRAKFNLQMPSGATIEIDEPETGEATLLIQLPGAEISIDQDGNIAITSDEAITLTAEQPIDLIAPTVNIGAADGTQNLAFHAELQALRDALQSHTHSGVQSGGATSGPPLQVFPVSVGTENTLAV